MTRGPRRILALASIGLVAIVGGALRAASREVAPVVATFEISSAKTLPGKGTGWAPVSHVVDVRGARMSGAMTSESVAVFADRLLRANAARLGIDTGLSDLRLESAEVMDFDGMGWRVWYRQVVRGVHVFRGFVKVFLTPDGDVFQVNVHYRSGARTIPIPDCIGNACDEAIAAATSALATVEITHERGLGGLEDVTPEVERVAFVPDPARTAIEPFILPTARGDRPAHGVTLVDRRGLAYLVFVDAQTHRPLASEPSWRGATTFGRAQVWDPNPRPSQNDNPSDPRQPVMRTIATDGSCNLRLPILDVDSNVPDLPRACSTDGNFVYFGLPYPDFIHLDEAMTHYHLTRCWLYHKNFGFGRHFALRERTKAYAIDTSSPFSYYDIRDRTIHMAGAGSGIPQSEDSDLTRHEYGHFVHHAIGGPRFEDYPFDRGPSNPTINAGSTMDEGLADYRAISFQDWDDQPRDLAEYDASGNGDPFVRTARSSYTTARYCNTPHDCSYLISAPFFDLRDQLGKGIGDRIANALVYLVNPDDSLNEALEGAILPADRRLYGGIHEDVIRQTFAWRGIGSYDYASGAVATGARPYADDEDSSFAYDLPGATAIRLVFDANTGAYENWITGVYDTIRVTDRSGADVPGSPFTGRSLRGQVVRVPGDRAVIALHSIAGNSRQGAGWRILAAADESAPNTPPVASFTIAPTTRHHVLDRIRFDASASNEPDGRIVMYEFDFGDHSPKVIGPLPRVEHLYTHYVDDRQTRAQTVTLTVTDDQGTRTTTTVPLTLYSETRR